MTIVKEARQVIREGKAKRVVPYLDIQQGRDKLWRWRFRENNEKGRLITSGSIRGFKSREAARQDARYAQGTLAAQSTVARDLLDEQKFIFMRGVLAGSFIAGVVAFILSKI